MPQVLFIWFLIAIFLLFSPLQDRNPPENVVKIRRFQANGLSFTGILGERFSMCEDATGNKIELHSAWTPFSLDKGDEEVSFNFEINENQANYYDFSIRIEFEEKERQDIFKLIGSIADSHSKKCIKDSGVPLSLYVKIINGVGEYIFDGEENNICFSGSGYNKLNGMPVVLKRIHGTFYLPQGHYTIYIKNNVATSEFIAYKLSMEIHGMFY